MAAGALKSAPASAPAPRAKSAAPFVDPSTARSTPARPPKVALPDHVQVAIIGGGVNGLGTAYQLAKAGMRDIVVLERRYIPYGASGRNGGGVRAQFGTPDNVALARDSIPMFRELSTDLDFNIWFRQGGYLFLAFTDEQVAMLKRTVAFHKTVAVPSRLVDSVEASILAPDLSLRGVVGGAYSPTDGVLFPWSVVFGYWRKLREWGIPVLTYTEVEGFDMASGRIRSVRTSRGTVRADWVVNAAGCWSREIAQSAGVSLPNLPVRHEIMASEAVKPFLNPMVVDLRNGLYMSQDMRGEVIAGVGHAGEPAGVNFASSFDFAKRIARGILDLFPMLGDLRLMRQWAGSYDVTPDNKPILGPAPGVSNFIQLNGASGHGFMISPMTTAITADILLGKRPRLELAPFLLDRFAAGRIERDPFTIG
ncbi:MAG: NAD(P)/FAD-dependent oxidoreductase [Thermoplasmatota archaeon]